MTTQNSFESPEINKIKQRLESFLSNVESQKKYLQSINTDEKLPFLPTTLNGKFRYAKSTIRKRNESLPVLDDRIFFIISNFF